MHVIRNTSVSFLSSLKEKRKRYSAGIFGTATTLKKFNDPPNIFRSSLNPLPPPHTFNQFFSPTINWGMKINPFFFLLFFFLEKFEFSKNGSH